MHKVAFFTEAGTKRGYGHLIRCYTIYEEFAKHENATFFLESDINFYDKYDDIHLFSWSTLQITTFYDIIFVDSYEANIGIYNFLAEKCKLLVCLDDFARLQYPPCAILNFAPDAQELFFKEQNQQYTYLLGLDYLPIRKIFTQLHTNKQEQIFIMLGGSDSHNMTLEIVETLQDINLKKVVVHNDLQTVKKLQTFPNIDLLYKPDDVTLIRTMKQSSIAITTASMSSYELAYARVPSIGIGLTHNQKEGMKQLLKHKIIAFSLCFETKQWRILLKKYINKIMQKQYEITNQIDANGTQRIYTEIMDLI